MTIKISPPEYMLMKKYIEEHCGIHLRKDKEYLIESRLSDLVEETGSRSFQEFHFKARTDRTGRLANRIVDAMTTNETSWFRDKSVWEYLEAEAVPALLDKAACTGGASVWSAAVSTGQEIYSLLMLLDEAARNRGEPELLDRIQLLGSDISTSALFTAISAQYDSIAINRGLAEDRKKRYFRQVGNLWVLDPALKSRVAFKLFNLQNSFVGLPRCDLVLCRNVSIYFSDRFRQELFAKMASVIVPGGVLILGATESLREYSRDFDISYYGNAVINTRK